VSKVGTYKGVQVFSRRFQNKDFESIDRKSIIDQPMVFDMTPE
jgi:hypothetical protein